MFLLTCEVFMIIGRFSNKGVVTFEKKRRGYFLRNAFLRQLEGGNKLKIRIKKCTWILLERIKILEKDVSGENIDLNDFLIFFWGGKSVTSSVIRVWSQSRSLFGIVELRVALINKI